MTRPHVHRWALGDPVGPDVWGQCACGEVKRFDAFIPPDYADTRHRNRGATKEQLEERTALMSHAQSLAAS